MFVRLTQVYFSTSSYRILLRQRMGLWLLCLGRKKTWRASMGLVLAGIIPHPTLIHLYKFITTNVSLYCIILVEVLHTDWPSQNSGIVTFRNHWICRHLKTSYCSPWSFPIHVIWTVSAAPTLQILGCIKLDVRVSLHYRWDDAIMLANVIVWLSNTSGTWCDTWNGTNLLGPMQKQAKRIVNQTSLTSTTCEENTCKLRTVSDGTLHLRHPRCPVYVPESRQRHVRQH